MTEQELNNELTRLTQLLQGGNATAANAERIAKIRRALNSIDAAKRPGRGDLW